MNIIKLLYFFTEKSASEDYKYSEWIKIKICIKGIKN
jgi:hypothetical protein